MTVQDAITVSKQAVVDEDLARQVVETYIEWKKGVSVTIEDIRRYYQPSNPLAIMKYQQELGKLMKAYEIASNAFLNYSTNG